MQMRDANKFLEDGKINGGFILAENTKTCNEG